MQRNIVVVPVIGIIWDKMGFNPVPNADEVESIFDAPLEMFLKVCVLIMLIIHCSCLSCKLLKKILAFCRMKIGEKRNENGWEINICSISLITGLRMICT